MEGTYKEIDEAMGLVGARLTDQLTITRVTMHSSFGVEEPLNALFILSCRVVASEGLVRVGP